MFGTKKDIWQPLRLGIFLLNCQIFFLTLSMNSLNFDLFFSEKNTFYRKYFASKVDLGTFALENKTKVLRKNICFCSVRELLPLSLMNIVQEMFELTPQSLLNA